MLVLTRKKEEAIVINGNVTIKVLQIKGNMVRLGIAAPDSMKILRSELCPIPSELEVECTNLEPAVVRERGISLSDYLRSGFGEAPALLTVTA
jgi:carbon storage regulator